MSPEEHVAHIQQTLAGIEPAWPFLQAHIEQQIATLTGALINQDNEQTRGRIKALAELLALPDTLQQTRNGIQAGLAEQASAQ